MSALVELDSDFVCPFFINEVLAAAERVAVHHGGRCEAGTCRAPTCPSGQTLCGGMPCAADESCEDGTCGSCAAGETLCSGACVDLMTSRTNCGSCGNACPFSMPFCSAGTCASRP